MRQCCWQQQWPGAALPAGCPRPCTSPPWKGRSPILFTSSSLRGLFWPGSPGPPLCSVAKPRQPWTAAAAPARRGCKLAAANGEVMRASCNMVTAKEDEGGRAGVREGVEGAGHRMLRQQGSFSGTPCATPPPHTATRCGLPGPGTPHHLTSQQRSATGTTPGLADCQSFRHKKGPQGTPCPCCPGSAALLHPWLQQWQCRAPLRCCYAVGWQGRRCRARGAWRGRPRRLQGVLREHVPLAVHREAPGVRCTALLAAEQTPFFSNTSVVPHTHRAMLVPSSG